MGGSPVSPTSGLVCRSERWPGPPGAGSQDSGFKVTADLSIQLRLKDLCSRVCPGVDKGPPKIHSHPEPQDMTLCGNRAFAGAIK